jgi:hypothetical protein
MAEEVKPASGCTTEQRVVGRLNRDKKSSIAHALMHLESNHIADDEYQGHSGWYCGNREQFVNRHKKAIALLRSFLTPNAANQARSDSK